MNVTKDSEKLLVTTYKIYIERRKSGIKKDDAKHFEFNFYLNDKYLSKWIREDVVSCLRKLVNKNLIWFSLSKDFVLNDDAIILMENRFKDGVKEIKEWLSLLIP
ncbi:MAG: hypothetical protein FWE74_07610 [Oscillospiraceae bacterium]|nr:hypothetical protein [Oscillospiraceae bacterium]